ncbi:ERCC4 domain-containing protein [Lunatimonas salinarum]|uniref:ERCC4 domain-containing protein n=1 Tax=Lunatimonas salinarum TaxID=1774590 RepID=UPI001ADF9911|nr:ERCC4 domain-containing protein [Lunatimonas salinarum]
MERAVKITCDYREKPSGVPKLLSLQGCMVDFRRLDAGDYVINRQLVIERKSAIDFVQSLISKRLFHQCSLLVKSKLRPLILLEGDPFTTGSQISLEAVHGAILSVSTAWHIPIIQTKNTQDTAHSLLVIGNQQLSSKPYLPNSGVKSRRINRQKARFLQGLPQVGPVLAERILDHFGSLNNALMADRNNLQKVEGIGKNKALAIRHFLDGEVR